MLTTEPAHEDVARLLCGDRSASQVHGESVARIAERIAGTLGFNAYRRGRIRLAGALHDIGKSLIAAEILSKPGPLSGCGWSQVRLHPVVGEQILVGEGLVDIAPWVRAHHERFDGLGYPDGIRGTAIPIEARILAVADSYDAMVSGRPYSAPLDENRACEELRREAGGQFDPRIVAAFLLARKRRGALPQPVFVARAAVSA